MKSEERNICSNTLERFSNCKCSQCEDFIFRHMDGSIVPSDIKNYLITEKEGSAVRKNKLITA